MKRILHTLFVAVLLVLSTPLWAQFTNGKVYRIVCSGTTSVSLGASALTDVAAVSTSATDKSQQWYVTVSGSNYTFRNLANGRYLQGNNGTSAAWSLTAASNNFTVTAVNGNYAIRGASDTNGYAYMHKDAGNNIVSWASSNGNSQWTMHEVSYSISELDAVWAKVESLVVPSAAVTSYEEKLSAIFTDKACTQLNLTYAAKSVDQIKADENYQALPAALQAMVLKVKGGDWSEANAASGKNGWSHDYAKRFRVQMYEPYSIAGEITEYLNINAHCNMDNPTGIYANADEAIYIMVDGDIADGAELWIAHQAGFGSTADYNNNAHLQLKEGLNVIPYFNDASTLWINYVVHTYNKNGATIAEKFPHKISDYKPLKIHIEGGNINGYFNAIGDFRATDSGTEDLWGAVDNDDDWNYYKERAPLNGTDGPNRDFPLLGHRQTLLFPLGQAQNDEGGTEQGLLYHLDRISVVSTPNCYGGSGNKFGTYAGSYPGMGLSTQNGKINIMLEAWDRITYSELATMGVVSKSTMDKMNALYPRWTSEGTPAEIYNYGSATVNNVTKTYQEFCQGIDYSEYFNHHACGVGASYGYMSGGWRVCNYHYNTMGSVIGKIAAESGPTWGPAHEIGHQHQTVFNLNGQTEVTNNFFSNVAVWYMGMGTSRVNGSEGSLESVLGAFNTDGNDLYTNNIWAIAHLYYRLWLYYHLAGNNTQFWPRLFELCRQVPLENGKQISGETSLLRFYQHACDAAGEDLTEFFRAHGFFEIMDNRLVGDYSNAIYNTTQEQIDAAIKSVKDKGYPVNYAALLINDATSETTKKHDGSTSRSLWDKNATAELGSVNDFIDGEIETLTNYTATVSADGTVTMSGGEGGIGFLVLNEDGELVSFSNKTEFALNDEAAYLLATGKATIVAVDTDSETAEAEVDLSAIQREMLEALIEKIEAMPIDDGTYTHIGFYTKASAADLLAAIESAKTVLASGTGFAAAYELLYTEKEKFVNSPNLSYVPFDPSLTYIITNYAYKDKTMYLSSGVRSNTGVDKTLDTSKWQFKTTGTDGVYNLYNVSGKYLAAASKSTLVSSVSDKASAATYSLIQDSPVGTWAISVSPAAEYATLHDNSHGNVVGWEAGASASKWYLTAIEGSTNSQATQAGDELQALVAKAETLMNEVATVSLKGKVQLQADNANSAFFISSNAPEAGHEPKYLLDNNVTTFFHTVWRGTSPGADHYLQIDLGEEYPIDQFTFKYTNLPTSSWNVDAANTIKVQGANIIDEFTDITTLTDLPTAKEGTYTSATLGAKGTNYRYIRLTVTNATGDKFDNHYYFGMSEFSLERLNSYSKVKDAYTDHITPNIVATVADKLVDAKTVIANGGDIAAAKAALQDVYDALLLEYNGVANAKKKELQDLIDATNGLIAQVGEATVIAGANVNLRGKLYAERVYTAGGTSNSDYSSAENGYNLLDGNVNTHFHSDYNTSTMVSPPYLRVDLGKGNSARKVNFNYTTRNQTGCAPKIINVYGGVAGVEYSQGAIQSSAALNAVTTPTKIVIKNLSGTNSKYFAGASNVTDINDAVLVWEPVTKGVAGRYYLRTTDAVSGYIQNGNTTIALGTKDNAQVFVTTSPSTTGTDGTYFNGEALVNADLGNLVRFVQEDGSTWLNVQNGDTGTPCLGNTGKGGWTVHNVYLVTETENDTPSYDATPIATFKTTDASNPLPTGTSAKWTSADIASTKDYRFFKFEVAESQGLNSGGYYFAISEFGFNIVGISSATINPEYQGLVSEELLKETRQEVDAAVTMKNIATSEDLLQVQIDKLQAAYDALEKAKNTPPDLDKTALQSLYDDALALYGEMVDGEGNVNDNYRPSALTNEKLAEAKTALDAAKTVLDSSNSQGEIDAAKTTLQEQYGALLVIKNANVATTIDKSGLNTAIANANTLIAAIEAKGDGYYESVTGFGLAELSTALQNAETVVDRFYLTEEQYTETLTQLNNCYTTTNGIFALDCSSENRNNLATLIGNASTLLGTIADEGETTVALPLQASNEGEAFYIWCNAPAGDSDGVAGLIDKNADGTANTGTFLGTNWGSDVPAYTHYIEVDLGVAGTIDQLTMDYTTRNSTHADQRPNAIKILGSNDKVNYTEITEITSGLAANANEQWSMAESLDLCGHYRYIRVAVGSQRGFFHMADFNLYTKLSHTLKEYYTTAEGLDFVTLCLALDEANDAAAHYMITEQYTAVYNKLSSCYTTVDDVYKADYKGERSELATLINDVTNLLSRIATAENGTYTLNEYYTTATGLGFEALCNALQDAQNINPESYISATAYEQTRDLLSNCYVTAGGVVEADYLSNDNRQQLKDLVAATNELVAQVNEVNKNEVVVPLQVTDPAAPYYIYCNAPGKTNNYSGDNQGVAVLLDVDESGEPVTATFLHTTYTGNSHDDELDHYLRVDMGESKLLSFKFRYTPRIGNTGNAPLVMLIEGSNDCVNFEEITTLTDMPTTYQSGEITNGKAYRYIRFMVKDTYNHSVYNGHKYFAMSHFEMTACKTVAVKNEYSATVSLAQLVNANNSSVDGALLATHYVTEAGYTAALAALQSAYENLAALILDRSALRDLLAEIRELVNSVYDFGAVLATEELPLQNAYPENAYYLYCNAPGENNRWDDDGGVAALIDKNGDGTYNTGTYLHTPYDTDVDDNADGLDHYLRVDLGKNKSLAEFVFSYTGRSGYNKLTPKKIVVEGCNTVDGEYEEIATFENLPASVDKQSVTVEGGTTAYRFLRFMVTETNDGRECNGHPYFALSSFSLSEITERGKELKPEYASTMYLYTTGELLAETDEAIASADALYNQVVVGNDEYAAELESLQAAYDKLDEAIRYYWTPVVLTTSETAPVLYKIFIKRTADVTVLGYDEPTMKVAVQNTADNNSWQAWYFMQGESDKSITIHPYNADGKVLGANDTSDGAEKVDVVANGEKTYDEWKIVAAADGYYNIKEYSGRNYFSNHTGTGKKMGFFNSSTDNGSLFKFVKAEFENNNPRYYQLSDVKASMPLASNLYVGTSVGLYSAESVEAYSAKYDEVSTVVEAGSVESANDICYAAYNELRSAHGSLSYNAPDPEKFYVIVSVATNGYCAGNYIYTTDVVGVPMTERLKFGDLGTIPTKHQAIFQFEESGKVGEYKIKNLYTGLYVKTYARDANHMAGADDAAIIKIAGYADGQVTLKIDSDAYPMHAQQNGSVIVPYGASAGNASLWTINEYNDELAYSVQLNTAKNDGKNYGTFYAAHAVKKQQGIAASYITHRDGGYLKMTEIEGDIIPANTPVILTMAKEDKTSTASTTTTLAYSASPGNEIEDENMLQGCLYAGYIDCADPAEWVYTLGRSNNIIAMYKSLKNYLKTENTNDEGVVTSVAYEKVDATGNSVKLGANKAYLKLSGTEQENISTYSFWFGGETTGVSGIDDENPLEGTIYDLHGRKLSEINTPGYYIINGKKTYVSEVK